MLILSIVDKHLATSFNYSDILDPRFSVIIPTYNRASTLIRSIRSVLDQTVPAWEIIVVDDGSSDNTLELVKKFPQVHYHYQVNSGVCAARNQGAKIAIGEWIVFLDSDDQFRLGFFECLEKEISISSEFDFLVFGINRIKGVHEEKSLPKDGEYFSRIPGTFAIRKTVFDQVGGYDERFRFAENTELFHRLDLIQAKGNNIPIVSLNYYDNSSGGSKNLQNMIDSLTLILEKHDETLTPHVKHLYHQIIGVNWIRFRNFSQARRHLFQALKYKPTKMTTWGRLCLACFPIIARRFYSETVNHG